MENKKYHMLEIKDHKLSLITATGSNQFSTSIYEILEIKATKIGLLKNKLIVSGIDGLIFDGETICIQNEIEKCSMDISEFLKGMSIDERRKKIIESKDIKSKESIESSGNSKKENDTEYSKSNSIEISNLSGNNSSTQNRNEKNVETKQIIDQIKEIFNSIVEFMAGFYIGVLQVPETNNRPYGNYIQNKEKYKGMVPCNTCVTSVAWGAKLCPHCSVSNPSLNYDEEISKARSISKFILIIFIIGIVFSCSSTSSTSSKKECEAWVNETHAYLSQCQGFLCYSSAVLKIVDSEPNRSCRKKNYKHLYCSSGSSCGMSRSDGTREDGTRGGF